MVNVPRLTAMRDRASPPAAEARDRLTAIDRRPEVSTPGAGRAVWPFDDPARPKFGRKVALAGRDPAAHGDAGLVHAVGRTRDERMPVVQIPSLGDQPIGAGDREPAQSREPRPASISRNREPAGDAADNRGTGMSWRQAACSRCR